MSWYHTGRIPTTSKPATAVMEVINHLRVIFLLQMNVTTQQRHSYFVSVIHNQPIIIRHLSLSTNHHPPFCREKAPIRNVEMGFAFGRKSFFEETRITISFRLLWGAIDTVVQCGRFLLYLGIKMQTLKYRHYHIFMNKKLL